MGVGADFIVGILGNISGVCLFLSPVFTFYGIFRKKTTDNFSSTPYLCALLNCALWLLYGMPFVTANGVLIMTINGIGALLEMSYLSIFMIYAPHSDKVLTAKVGGLLGVFYLIVGLVVSLGVHHLHGRHTTVGVLCVIVTIVMYAAPLSVMRLVIKSKSVEYMPLPLSIMVLINSAAWSAYALLKKDIYIMIPNFFGVVLGVVQLVLYGCYHGAQKTDLDEDLEMRHKPTQPESITEMAALGTLNSSTPSEAHASNIESGSLPTKNSNSPLGSLLPTYSAVPFSAHTLRT